MDPDAEFARELRHALKTSGFESAYASTGSEAIETARAGRPAVVLTETHLPDVSGYEVCRTLRRDFGHEVAIAFLSATRTDDADVSAGLLLGADDYITKPCNLGVVLARARTLLRRVPSDDRGRTSDRGQLTKREIEILGLLANGLGQKDIASNLSISPSTVARHVEHILQKLGVHSRAHAVSVAYRNGLLLPSNELHREVLA